MSVKLSPKLNSLRDIPVLLNKWERLHNRIKENVAQTGVYAALKNDVISFKRDLASLLERTEEPGHTDEDEEHESRLHTFKVFTSIILCSVNLLYIAKCQGDRLKGIGKYLPFAFQDAMIELSDFKSHLFELNLSVHNFLAELNSSQVNGKSKFERAVHLKEDVIGLYTMWDRWVKRWHLVEIRRQILKRFLHQGAPSNSGQHREHRGGAEEAEMLRDRVARTARHPAARREAAEGEEAETCEGKELVGGQRDQRRRQLGLLHRRRPALERGAPWQVEDHGQESRTEPAALLHTHADDKPHITIYLRRVERSPENLQ